MKPDLYNLGYVSTRKNIEWHVHWLQQAQIMSFFYDCPFLLFSLMT
uniref:Uncharacterized protein n=1 Tax=Rhizophora mucronata TaxID=61149 RepID=A0A2P2IWS5_RHIMU